MDNVANLLHEPAARQVRHTEFQAVSLSGAWLDPLQSSTCSEPPSDECAPPGALAAPPAGPTQAVTRIQRYWRCRSSRGSLRCTRCEEVEVSRGGHVEFHNGRVMQLSSGGLALRMSLVHGFVRTVQCSECSRARHGRGLRRWVSLAGRPQLRGRLLGNGGALLCRLRSCTGAAIEVPDRHGPDEWPVYGTLEQHWRVDEGMRILVAGGDRISWTDLPRVPLVFRSLRILFGLTVIFGPLLLIDPGVIFGPKLFNDPSAILIPVLLVDPPVIFD